MALLRISTWKSQNEPLFCEERLGIVQRNRARGVRAILSPPTLQLGTNFNLVVR